MYCKIFQNTLFIFCGHDLYSRMWDAALYELDLYELISNEMNTS